MTLKSLLFALFTPVTVLCNAGQGPAPATPTEAVQAVKVSSTRDPDFKTYRAFARGLDAFDTNHGMAPKAALRFLLKPFAPGASIDGVTIRIAGSQTSIAVPVNADGTFVITRSQAAYDEDAEVLLNRKKGNYRWRPDFHSAGVPANARRLGDLRLECAVRWQVERTELSFFKRNLIGAMGACNSRSIQVLNLAPRTLAGYTLVSGERRVRNAADTLQLQGAVYIVPLNDKSWPDDTLVEFDYAPQT